MEWSDDSCGIIAFGVVGLIVLLILAILFIVITCPVCGTHFPGMGKYCLECGNKLPSSACPVCGSRNTGDFCGSCGSSIPNN